MATFHSLQTTNYKLQTQDSFTIAEVIIAITLFAVLSVVGVVLWGDIKKTAQKTEMEEYLYTETQALLNRLTRTVQASAIDYEEYYNQSVLGGDFGKNYGEYHQHFFHPGTAGVYGSAGPDPDGYGAYCTDGSEYPDPGCPTGRTVADVNTFDYDTGQHPYLGSGIDPEDQNAVCEVGSTCTTTLTKYDLHQLYLINPEGTHRTYFAIEEGAVPTLATIELEGADSDGNGLIDTWTCDSDFSCDPSTGLPNADDLTDGKIDDSDFFPISPRSIWIEEVHFYIAPLEDPFKGYAETSAEVFENVQWHPRVTIVIKAHYQLYDSSGNPVAFEEHAQEFGEAPKIRLQTTVSTGATAIIPTYTFP